MYHRFILIQVMFNNIFNLNKNNMLGIDIGLSSIKAVELLANNNGLFLKDYKELYLAPVIGKDIGDIAYMGSVDIVKLIAELIGSNEYGDISIGYPANNFVILTLSLAIESEGLEEYIIPIETKKYFNFFDISQYDIKYEKLPDNILNNNKLNYVVMLWKNREINFIKDSLNKNKIQIDNIESNSLGGVRVLSGLQDEIVIDMGSAWTSLSFIKNGALIHMETISTGSTSITNTIKNTLSIDFQKAEEIKKSSKDKLNQNIIDIIDFAVYNLASISLNMCHNIEVRYNINYKNIILTGGGANVFNAMDVFQKLFEGKNVIFRNAFNNIQYIDKIIEFKQETSNIYANAIGSAIYKYKK